MNAIKRLALGGCLVAALALPSGAAAAPTFCHGKAVTIYAVIGRITYGTAGDDVILGTLDEDWIVSGDGNDTVCGRGGRDTIDAGSGNDWVHAGVGWDEVWGRDGNDVLIGSQGSDWLNAGAGNDICESRWGADTLLHCETVV